MRLDGSMTTKQRAKIVATFNDPEVRKGVLYLRGSKASRVPSSVSFYHPRLADVGSISLEPIGKL